MSYGQWEGMGDVSFSIAMDGLRPTAPPQAIIHYSLFIGAAADGGNVLFEASIPLSLSKG
jgi:hypothetical protein